MKVNEFDVMGRACLWLSGFAACGAVHHFLAGRALMGFASVVVAVLLALSGRPR